MAGPAEAGKRKSSGQTLWDLFTQTGSFLVGDKS